MRNTTTRRGWWVRAGGALVCALCLMLGGCGETAEELVLVETEKEANRILVELANQGIISAHKVEKAEQRKKSFAISVSRADLPAARGVLVRFDLPRAERGGFAAMIGATGLIPTRSDERAKMMHAIASELEKTFEVYDRVLTARVHIVLPEKDVLEREPSTRPTASAMVLIKYKAVDIAPEAGLSATRPGEPGDVPITREEIKKMVARSTEGLTPEQVEVAYERVVYVRQNVDLQVEHQRLTARLKQREGLLQGLALACCGFAVVAIVLVFLLIRARHRSTRAAKARAVAA